jgi:hypothetical protein
MSSALPSIVDPLRPIIKLLVAKLPPSVIITYSPVTGVAGNVTVKDPPDVSAISLSPSTAV